MKLLKFEANWCAPCKMMSKIMADVDLGVDVVPIDVDIDPDKARGFNIRGVPTMVLVDDQEREIKRHVGLLTEQELVTWVNGGLK